MLCEYVPCLGGNLSKRLASAGFDPIRVDDFELIFDARTLHSNGAQAIPIILFDTAPLRLVSTISRMRECGVDNPIVIVSTEFESRLKALMIDAGADEVIETGMGDGELRARVNAILRRLNNMRTTSILMGDLVISLLGEQPAWRGTAMNLTAKEISVLRLIAQGNGRPVARDEIYNALYGLASDPPYKRVIDVYICTMRKKFTQTTGRKIVQTIPGGYYKLGLDD